ncbi:MAG: hypothetical protein ACOC55_04205 [Candidatus Natronoplasma sp.]
MHNHVKTMNKNEKKKNAIRFGALAVAILIFGGIFSVWALSTQATADAWVGDISSDDIVVEAGENTAQGTNEKALLQTSVAGRPGSVATDYELFSIDDSAVVGTDFEGSDYSAIVYLTNGDALIEDDVRHLTLDLVLEDSNEGELDSHTLTLENGRAALEFTGGDIDAGSVMIEGGSYGTYTFIDTLGTQPSFMIDVEPGAADI